MKKLYFLALSVVLLVLNISLIKNENQRKTNRMWYNPSTWTPVDAVQNGISDLFNVAQTTANSSLSPGSVSNVSNLSVTDPTQTNTPAFEGALAYNADGTISEFRNGQWVTYAGNQAGQNTTQNTTTTVDPNAQTRSVRDAAITSIYGSANDAATNLQGKYANSVQDNLHVLRQNQEGIDLKAQNNEASRIQGIGGILGMVGRGIASGGRYLANRNAGNSSAAGEIARAYSDIGKRQMSSVGNQYEMNNQEIMRDQSNQDYNVGKTKRDFNQSLMDSVNSIVESARVELANLDAQTANASLPDRIAIEQEKQNIKNQVLAKLQQYDAQLASGADQIKARDRQGNLVAANQQLDAGQVPANNFQYTDQVPGQFQNTGPFSTGLPIFINPNKRQLA